MKHYAYMVRCADKTIYSGYTTDLEHRINAHNCGTGAKYTRSRRPVVLAYYKTFDTKSDAMKYEAKLKTLSHAQKEILIQNFKA